jgi:hypothetical protein
VRLTGIPSSSALAFLAIAFLSAQAAPAAEIPPAIVQAYRAGTRDVTLDSEPVRIPLDGTNWYGDYLSPYMRVYVNGKGPFTFLFDTGSTITWLSPRLVRAANVAVVSRVPGHHEIALMKDVRIGGVRLRNLYAGVDAASEVDGLLGFNSFANDYLTFDFPARALLVSSRPVALPSQAWIPYVLPRSRVPIIDLSIDGKTLPTLIDTGDDAWAWEATTANLRGLQFDHAPVVAENVYNSVTGFTRTYATSIDGVLKLGPFASARTAVGINDALPVPDIGCDILKQFVVEFDRHKLLVAFQPAFHGTNFLVPGLLTPGFSISYRHPGRPVSDILPELEPARAGMRQGDRILTIDGTRATDVSFRTWDELLRTRRPVSIEWSGKGGTSRHVFPILELR